MTGINMESTPQVRVLALHSREAVVACLDRYSPHPVETTDCATVCGSSGAAGLITRFAGLRPAGQRPSMMA